MRPEERDPGLLWDMRDMAIKAAGAVEQIDYERFLQDQMLRLAIERLLQNIGEAARRLSPEFTAAHPEVAWRDMVGQRNVLAHEYGSIDPSRLWETLSDDLPALIPALDALIATAQEKGDNGA
jgi:uncharacterized protein with HEPN domain